MVNLTTPVQINWIILLIGIDVVLGILAALLKKEFRLGKVAKFMGIPVLGYVFGFTVLASVAPVWITKIAFWLIVLALVGSILNNLGKLGVNIPAYLKKE